MFNFREWGERIVAENEFEGSRARWELYQGEEGRAHYQLDQQRGPLQDFFSDFAAAVSEAVSILAEAIKPVLQEFSWFAAMSDYATKEEE